MKVEKLYTLRITGIVQGVFFRKSAQQKARDLNVKGFVENRNDGSVYLEAQGDERSLEAFLEWCQQGPPRAVVDAVDCKQGQTKELNSFSIKR